MNILQILPELNVGGVETGTVDLSNYLVKQSHKSVVVSAGGELVKDLEAGGAIHFELPVHNKSLITIIKMSTELADIIVKENIDIVHARSRVPAWIAFFACRKTGAKFITTCHGYYSKHFFSRVMGWPKLVIVISQVIGRHMIDDVGVPAERIRLIHRSVDLDKFRFKSPDERSKTEFTVGIIGRITPLKGHTYFLRAMSKVARSFPFIKILIVGDVPKNKEPYLEELHTLVRRLGLSHYVQFLGSQKNIPEILDRLNVLVLSTVTEEAFGRVIVEAQASGVPVVATKVGGVVDIIDDKVNGILVPPKDEEAMANAVINILKDATLAKRLVLEARKKAEKKFNLELMAKKTLDAYFELQSSLNILIIKMSATGDVILSTPSIRSIRNKFPKARIYCVIDVSCREVLQRCPYLDGLIVNDFKRAKLKDILKVARYLRRYYFDIVVDLQNNSKSHLLAFLSTAYRRYGYKNKKLGFLLNHAIEDDGAVIGPVEHQFKTLELLGIKPDDDSLELWTTKDDEVYIDGLLESNWVSAKDQFVGINLGASRKWVTKNWPLNKFAKLCDELAKKNIRVIIVGSEDNICLSEELLKLTQSKPIIATGKTTINQLACLIKRCEVFISADSAPLHVAASVKTSLVALFGPTSPERHMPPVKNAIIIKCDIKCSPCYKPSCKTKSCMEDISVEEVLKAVESLIEKKRIVKTNNS